MTGVASCSCTTPLPLTRAVRKGAATTECARCGLPVTPTLRQARPAGGVVVPDTIPEENAAVPS